MKPHGNHWYGPEEGGSAVPMEIGNGEAVPLKVL